MSYRDNAGVHFTLSASSAKTATSAGEAEIELPLTGGGIAFVLDLTVDESTAADTCDVFVQSEIGGDGDWVDVVHFTQLAGNAGAATYVSKICSGVAQAEFETGTALGAAALRNLLGDRFRVRYDIVDDSGSASFTFSVVGTPM